MTRAILSVHAVDILHGPVLGAARSSAVGGEVPWLLIVILLALLVAYLVAALLRSIGAAFEVARDAAGAGFRGVGALVVTALAVLLALFVLADRDTPPGAGRPAAVEAPSSEGTAPVDPPIAVG